jgi:ABC-type spermidine/putrescine transport system permease subunit I
MKTKEPSRLTWYNKSSIAVLIVVVSLVLAYAVSLRAIDTGSLQQYLIVIILVGFAINRIARIASSVRSQKGKAL